VMFATMALLSTPIVMATWRTSMDPAICYSNPGVIVLTGALTLFCTIGAFVWMNKWQPLVPATEASIIYGAEPVIASFLALFLPGIISKWTRIDYQDESITWEMIVGGALILGANIFLQVRWMRERRTAVLA
jgi:drug/metabolite transporter (DMT)-like permease